MLARLADGDRTTLCHTIDYEEAEGMTPEFRVTVRDHMMVAHSLPR